MNGSVFPFVSQSENWMSRNMRGLLLKNGAVGGAAVTDGCSSPPV